MNNNRYNFSVNCKDQLIINPKKNYIKANLFSNKIITRINLFNNLIQNKRKINIILFQINQRRIFYYKKLMNLKNQQFQIKLNNLKNGLNYIIMNRNNKYMKNLYLPILLKRNL